MPSPFLLAILYPTPSRYPRTPLYDVRSFLGIIKAVHMIPMDSKSCEWLFVGQNKNFDELNEVLGSIRGVIGVASQNLVRGLLIG